MNRVSDPQSDACASTRAGHVVLIGLPNAGKSTLVNALVGEHLSIVTPKAQTTWQRIVAIRSERTVQMVFVDTPGILSSSQLFHRFMVWEVESALGQADIVLCVVDGAARMDARADRVLVKSLGRVWCPAAVIVNKRDEPGYDVRRADPFVRVTRGPVFCVSARRGQGLAALLAFLRSELPVGPFLYPRGDIAAAPVRFFVGELIREAVFGRYHHEIPYAVAVRIDEFREGENPVYIAATLYVEQRSQKGILIGKNGEGIRALGKDARGRVEQLLGRRVYLDLWVKVWPRWRRRSRSLRDLGYTSPSGLSGGVT